MMKRLLLPLLLLVPFVLCAQQNDSSDVPFNGLVKDLSGKGVKVRVFVKNSDKRTVADREGRFGLTNLKPTDTLLLQYRREKVEIPLDGRRSLKVLWGGEQPPTMRTRSWWTSVSAMSSGVNMPARRRASPAR